MLAFLSKSLASEHKNHSGHDDQDPGNPGEGRHFAQEKPRAQDHQDIAHAEHGIGIAELNPGYGREPENGGAEHQSKTQKDLGSGKDARQSGEENLGAKAQMAYPIHPRFKQQLATYGEQDG